MLFDSTVSQSDLVLFAELPKALAEKLSTLISNNVFGGTPDIGKSLVKHSLHVPGTRPLLKNSNPDACPGKMVNNNTSPPAERPAQR